MGTATTSEYWERVYAAKSPDQVSWFRPHLETSLAFVRRASKSFSASIVDVGGGVSSLAGDLFADGYRDISILDISQTALDCAKERLGAASREIQWIHADITSAELPPQAYDVWHDRAVFHFLTNPEQRAAYVRQAMRAVKPGGHVIVGTFGPEGPEKCSGLHVARYDADGLHGEFGAPFELIESAQELHVTPFGTTQQFVYCFCALRRGMYNYR
jgi:SAM-dependent methyltransferase